jgi:hypothetical protein
MEFRNHFGTIPPIGSAVRSKSQAGQQTGALTADTDRQYDPKRLVYYEVFASPRAAGDRAKGNQIGTSARP